MSTPVWEVKLCQINVSQDEGGDCAIILLLDTTPSPPEVASAVLIDGGNGVRCTDILIKTMQSLEKQYTFSKSPGSKFKFDAVCISHWDIDHWKGFCFNYKAVEPGAIAKGTVQQYNFLKDPRYGFIDTRIHTAFRYDTTADKNPLTRFYCQVFSTVNSSNAKPSKKRDMNPDSSVSGSQRNMNVKGKGNDVLKNVLKGYIETDVILGVNLFNGLQLPIGQYKTTSGLVSLIKGNSPWKDEDGKDNREGAPGLYVWGVNKEGLGNKDLGIFTGKPKDTNAGSLMSLLVWCSKDPMACTKDDLRVSLYTGADAEYRAEEPLMSWLQADWSGAGCYRIDVVKAGHHGSGAGTSMKFIEAVKPDHFLISNGTEYVHPRPEVLWFMQGFFSKSPHSTGAAGPRIHGVAYPYWLGVWKENATAKDPKPRTQWLFSSPSNQAKALNYDVFNMDYKNKGTTPTTEETEWETLRKKISDYYGATNNQITQFTADLKTNSNAAFRRSKLLSYMSANWKAIAEPHFAYYPLRSDDWATVDGLAVLNHIEVTFNNTGKDCKVENVDLSNKARKCKKVPANWRQLKLTAAQKKKAEGLPLGDRKREYTTLDEDDDIPAEAFIMNKGQAVDMMKTDKEGEDISDMDTDEDLDKEQQVAVEDPTPPILAAQFVQIVVDEISENDSALRVPVGSNLYYLIGGLHDQCMNLNSEVSNDGQAWQEELIYGDEFATFIANIFYFDPTDFNPSDKATPVALTSFSPWGQRSSTVDGFRIDVENFCGTNWTLVWKSENVLSQLVLGASTYQDRLAIEDSIEFYGMIKDTKTLVMGLDIRPGIMQNPDPVQTFKLIDVLHLIGYIDPENQNVAAIPWAIMGQTGNIQLKLDYPAITDFQTQDDTHSEAVQAMWFVPNNSYSTTLRIDFIETSNVLTQLLDKVLLNCTVDKVRVSAVRKTQFFYDPPYDAQIPALLNSGEMCLKTSIRVGDADVASAWQVYITFDQTSLTFILRWPHDGNPLSNFLAWAEDELGDFTTQYKSFSQTLGNWSSDGKNPENFDILLREVCLIVDWSGNTPSFSFASMTLEMDLNWGVDLSKNPNGRAPFKIEFYYESVNDMKTFGMEASLWPPPCDIVAYRLNPDSPPYPLLVPACVDPVYTLSLEHLGIDSRQLTAVPIPAGLPKIISAMDLVIETDQIRFLAAFSISDQSIHDSPTLALDEVKFAALVTWPNNTISVDLSLDASATLIAKGTGLEPASLDANAEFYNDTNSSVWHLSGLVYNLTAAHIYCLFPSADRAGVMNVMQDIKIPEFNLYYTYDTSGAGFSFAADGFVTFGNISLGIDFQYNTGLPNQLEWQFRADMSWASDPEAQYDLVPANLLSVLQDIVPSSVSLPSFLANVRLDVEKTADIKLTCFRTAQTKQMVLALDASILDAEFTYCHISPVIDAQGLVVGDPTRILKCEIMSLPNVPGIPMLSSFEQPFQQAGFIWTSKDLTRSTVDLINEEVFKQSAHSDLVFKDPRLTTSDPTIVKPDQKDDLVILSGTHLVIVIEENSVPTAVVDYAFKTATAPAPDPDDPPTALVDDDPLIDPGANAPLRSSKGPLNVSGIGLKYQNPNLQITFNASIDLGVLKATLRGFGFQFNLASLFELRLDNVSLLIDGVGLELNDPPVSLLGEVLKKDAAYFGGVGLAIDPYDFLGGGFYGQTKYTDPKDVNATKTFDTTFVFAEIAGPFVELEFASLTGLTAGFGHDSHMTLPAVDNVTSFPFLKPVTGNDPLQVLNSFISPPNNGKAWFTHDPSALDEIWMAAGFTAKAFHALSVSTVMTVDFSASDVVLGLFGEATATVPPDAPSAEQFAMAQIGLLAVIDWDKGTFKVEGQLTPSSFILDKDCKLQGGFALCHFFEGSAHQGDWVFTIGGYHPSYVPPAWYPNPPRVGISWVLDSTITISGNAYFAVTPKSCMGGGKLDLTFHTGHLKAWFNAYADFLVNYKPFSFQVDSGISIGISYTIHVGCITKSFGVNFGCSLHIHGPPVAGFVHVGWSIISFDIHFGNANETTGPLNWLQFQDLIRQDGKTATPSSAPLLVKATATNGLMSNPDSDASTQISTADDTATSVSPTMWYVNHTKFAFDITSMFPPTEIVHNGSVLSEKDGFGPTAQDTFGVSHPINDVAMRPMHVKSKVISSILLVKVTNDHDGSITSPFVPTPIVKQMPTAVWDTYSESTDPLSKSFSSSSAFSSANSTKPLFTGINLAVPQPTETGPFIALDLATALSYDCYRDDPAHSPARLPSGAALTGNDPNRDGEDSEEEQGDPFTAHLPTYTDPTSQEQAFQDAKDAWQKSDNDALGQMLRGLAGGLGVRSGSAQEAKMVDFFGSFRPPEKLLGQLETAFVAPPLVSLGVV